jgi:hypothetical protein
MGDDRKRIKASIEVEIDPTPEEVLVRVERMDGDVLLVDADGYEIAVLTEETFNRAMVTPPVPWSLGWVDADGNPVLNDLSREGLSWFLSYMERLIDLGEFDTYRETAERITRALRKQLEADQ